MHSVARFAEIHKGFSSFCSHSLFRAFCCQELNGNDVENGFIGLENHFRETLRSYDFNIDEKPTTTYESVDSLEDNNDHCGNISARQNFIYGVRSDAGKILEILRQDGPGFDAKPLLNVAGIRLSGLLVREVLHGILKTINHANKFRYAKLGYKFFVWSGEQENYKHTSNAYNIMMKILSECEEFKAMLRLVDEIIENGYTITARTFNILICACGEAGLARKVVKTFVMSKNFSYGPYKHSYNAILHSLLTLHQYKLIEWVYQQMLVDGHSPDVLTYNIIMCANFRLGKLDQFHRLLDEMGRGGFSPDIHTFNLLLHVLGKGDKPLAAFKLLNHMRDAGINPSVLHFTTLIDGLSRAGNLDACRYFFNEMKKHGCLPDVVTYTVMITGYVVAGEFRKAQELFSEMTENGKLPNVLTYNSMIRGLCMVRKFKEARSMLKEMESKGCSPNFTVYATLWSFLWNAGRVSEAQEILKHLLEKGHYTHLLANIGRYKRC